MGAHRLGNGTIRVPIIFEVFAITTMGDRMMGSNAKGAILALMGFAVYSLHDVIIKVLGASYQPAQILFFSVLLGFPLTTVMLIRDSSGESLKPRRPLWTWIRTAAVCLTGLSAFYAFSKLPLAQTYAIIFATPLLITVLSIPILGETVRLRRWAAVIVGLLGVMVVLRPGETELGLGHLAALVAAFSSAIASIIVRKIGHEERSIVLLLYPMLANFVIMGAWLPFIYKPMPGMHLAGLGAIAAMALIAMMCMIFAYKVGEAVVVAPMQYSQILWASLYGWFFFGESVDTATMIGAAIIIASGLYILFREGNSDASENTPVLRTRSRPETGTAPRVGAYLLRMNKRKK